MKAVIAFSIFVLTIPSLVCCTNFLPKYDVPNSFEIFVSNDGEPTPSIMVVLRPRCDDEAVPIDGGQSPQRVNILSNRDGRVRFSDVAEGPYTVFLEYDGRNPDSACVHVGSRSSSSARAVTLHWPNQKVLVFNKLFSQLQTGLYSTQKGSPLSNAELTLIDASNLQVMRRQRSGETGRFDFGQPKAGLYFIHLGSINEKTAKASDWSPEGDIFVKIVSSTASPPAIYVAMTSCGLEYGTRIIDVGLPHNALKLLKRDQK